MVNVLRVAIALEDPVRLLLDNCRLSYRMVIRPEAGVIAGGLELRRFPSLEISSCFKDYRYIGNSFAALVGDRDCR